MQSKDKIINELQERIDALEQKEQSMLDFIQAQKVEYETGEADAAERQKIVESLAMAEVESEEITSDSDIQLAEDNIRAVNSYQDVCRDYHNTEVERTNNLNNMQKIIARLLKKGNVATGTQTDPVDFGD